MSQGVLISEQMKFDYKRGFKYEVQHGLEIHGTPVLVS